MSVRAGLTTAEALSIFTIKRSRDCSSGPWGPAAISRAQCCGCFTPSREEAGTEWEQRSALLQGRNLSSSESLWLLNPGQIAPWHASEPLFLLLLFPVCAALGTNSSYCPQGLHSSAWPRVCWAEALRDRLAVPTCGQVARAPQPASLCIFPGYLGLCGQSYFNKVRCCARRLYWEAVP